MIRYKKYRNMNTASKTYGQWYGRAVHQLMEFDEFVEHMAKHHCVYSEGTIRGVLIEMETCLREMLLEGRAVRFDDLGIFRLGIACHGADSSDDFTAANIHGVHMNLYLGSRFRAADLFKDAQFREADLYIGNGNYKPDAGGEDATAGDDTP